MSWAYWDALPGWRHLKLERAGQGRDPLETGGQLGFDF
jgi:hypothetical protein